MSYFYLANLSRVTVHYKINGGAVLPGRSSSPGPHPPMFTPRFILVSLARSPDTGVVGLGENAISAIFQDAYPEREWGFTFTIKHGSSIDDDVIAYLLRGALLVTTARGMPLVASTSAARPTHTRTTSLEQGFRHGECDSF